METPDNTTEKRETAKLVVSTAIVGLLMGGLVFGVCLRQKVDDAGTQPAPSRIEGLTASTSSQPVSIPLLAYYNSVEAILKNRYVDPIKDDQELASGAIRGMIRSLNDPDCQFYFADQYRQFLDNQRGHYEGIGVDIKTQNVGKREQRDDGDVSESEFTLNVGQLLIADVVPGSPAERAGIKPGDIPYSIDGHWIVNPAVIKKLGKAIDPKLPLTQQEAIAKQTEQKLQEMINSKPLTPNRAQELLTSGRTGTMTVVWNRGDTEFTTLITRSSSDSLLSGKETNGAYRLRFFPGAEKQLASFLDQNTGKVTLDVSYQPNGDFKTMVSCLNLILPSGKYGSLTSGPTNQLIPFQIKNEGKPTQVDVIVNDGTENAAAIFAEAILTAKDGELVGQNESQFLKHLTVSNEGRRVEWHELPDGSAFSLATGNFVSDLVDPKNLNSLANSPQKKLATGAIK